MTAPRVVGVDPATKNVGLAHHDGTLVTLNARTGADDPVRRLHELRRVFVRALELRPPAADLLVVEGYALGSPGRLGLVRLGEVGGMVRLASFDLAASLVEVPPSQLKRYATGRGDAQKADMVEAAAELGARFSRPLVGDKTDPHDEADAFLLRHLGRAAYGFEPLTEPHRLEVVAAITWPKL